MNVKKIALGLTAAVALAGFAGPQAASAKSISQIPVACSGPTSAYAIFMERGAEVTLGFGVNQGASVVGLWHVQIIDNGTNTIIDAPMNATTSGPWGISTTHTLPRGFHVVSITADNQTTGESCQRTLSFKN